MTSDLNSDMDDESWGIRDFYVFIAKCDESCTKCNGPYNTDCTICGIEEYLTIDRKC